MFHPVVDVTVATGNAANASSEDVMAAVAAAVAAAGAVPVAVSTQKKEMSSGGGIVGAVNGVGRRNAERERSRTVSEEEPLPSPVSASEELSPPCSPPDVRSPSPVPHAEETSHHTVSAEDESTSSSVGGGVVEPSGTLASEPTSPAPPSSPIVQRSYPFDRVFHFGATRGEQQHMGEQQQQSSESASSSSSSSSRPASFTNFMINGPLASTATTAAASTPSILRPSTSSRTQHPLPAPSTTSSPFACSTSSGSSGIRLLGDKYLLLEQSEALTWVSSAAATTTSCSQQQPQQQLQQPSSVCYKCIEAKTQKQFTCKVRF